MTAQGQDEKSVCGICGQAECPCALCHGDPLYYYGAPPASTAGEPVAAGTCEQCGVVTG